MVRTSHTHPLRIDALPLANGQLGITFCPGKKCDSVYGAAWDRDLDLDIDAIKSWGANAVLTLLKKHEFELLSVPNLGDAFKARGIEWFQLAIRDLDVPRASDAQKTAQPD